MRRERFEIRKNENCRFWRRRVIGRTKQWWMNVGRTVFSQLIEYLPSKEFQKCVARYDGDSRFRGFSCWDQLLAMCFAQLTYRESLRDIEACLRSMSGKLYHMGLRGKVARATLGDANETHDWRILCRLRPGSDRDRATASYSRSHRCRSVTESLRLGFDDHRSVPLTVPLGEI